MSKPYRFQVQVLDGYTDGKPSWRAALRKRFFFAEAAADAMTELQSIHQLRKYRIRKIAQRAGERTESGGT